MTHDEVEASYPALYQFLACYFHEDWYENVTMPEERLVGGPEPEPDFFRRVVRAYAEECSRSEAARALGELDRLLAEERSDADLAELLSRGFGLRYWPGSEEAYRSWLHEVRDTLDACLRAA